MVAVTRPRSDEINLFARWFDRCKWDTAHWVSTYTKTEIYLERYGEDVRMFPDFSPLRGEVWWR